MQLMSLGASCTCHDPMLVFEMSELNITPVAENNSSSSKTTAVSPVYIYMYNYMHMIYAFRYPQPQVKVHCHGHPLKKKCEAPDS